MWAGFESFPWRRHARQAAIIAMTALPACAHDPAERPQPVRLLLTFAPTRTGMQSLLDHYTATLPDVTVTQHGMGTSLAAVSALNAGEGDVALAWADVVYAAYRRGTENAPYPHVNLSAMAVLAMNKFYVFVRSGSALRRIEDLRGKRVALAQPGAGGSEFLTRIVLAAHDMSYADLQGEVQPFEEGAQRFAEGAKDAMIDVGGVEYDVRALSAPTDPHTLRLLPVSDAVIARLRAEYPFIKPVVLPPGELPAQHESIQTVGVDQLLICRRDLD